LIGRENNLSEHNGIRIIWKYEEVETEILARG
jgi:hypothetical protein